MFILSSGCSAMSKTLLMLNPLKIIKHVDWIKNWWCNWGTVKAPESSVIWRPRNRLPYELGSQIWSWTCGSFAQNIFGQANWNWYRKSLCTSVFALCTSSWIIYMYIYIYVCVIIHSPEIRSLGDLSLDILYDHFQWRRSEVHILQPESRQMPLCVRVLAWSCMIHKYVHTIRIHRYIMRLYA